MSAFSASSPPHSDLLSDDDKFLDSSSVSSSSTDSSLSYPPPTFPAVDATKTSRAVRFLIPTLEESSSTHQIFMTTDPAPSIKKFGPVSRWQKRQLDWLGVDYSPNVFYEFNFGSVDLSEGLSQRVQIVSEAMKTFDLKAAVDQPVDIDNFPAVMVPFVTANEELIKILRSRQTPSLQPCTPPNQTTVPANPKYSGDSIGSADSWSSSDSREEHFTHQFAYQFITASRRAVGKQLREIPWLVDGCDALISSTHQNMKLKLGTELIKVIDDGGLVLSSFKVDIYKIPPVLSIEAKRKKHKKRACIDTHYAHAAQIYGEMLGQVCHAPLYNNNYMKYQEAFVIHVRHATFYLFYARFPNTYLRSISERGTKYSPSTKIQLVQSRPYRMRKASDQAEFFRLLVSLFNYMFSGKSHIGYLNNNPSNPYVRRVDPIVHDCIVVENPMEVALEDNSEGELDGESDVPDDDEKNQMVID